MRSSILVLLMLCIGVFGLTAFGEAPQFNSAPTGLRIAVAVPQGGIWEIKNDECHLDIVILNVSNELLQFYDASNSFGFGHASFSWTDRAGHIGRLKLKPRGWDSNSTSMTTVAPGAAIVRSVMLKDFDNWPDFKNGPIAFTAIYESGEQDIAKKKGWLGLETSAPVKIEVQDRRAR